MVDRVCEGSKTLRVTGVGLGEDGRTVIRKGGTS